MTIGFFFKKNKLKICQQLFPLLFVDVCLDNHPQKICVTIMCHYLMITNVSRNKTIFT